MANDKTKASSEKEGEQSPKEESKKILVQQFYDSKHFSDTDKKVMDKMYGTYTKTEVEWDELLIKKFNVIKTQ